MHLRRDHMGRVELVGQTGDGSISASPPPGPTRRGLSPNATLQKCGLPVDTVAKMQLKNLPPYVAASTLRNGNWSDQQIATFLAANMQSPTREKIQAALRDSA